MLYEIIAYHLPAHRTTIISVLTLRRFRSLERRIAYLLLDYFFDLITDYLYYHLVSVLNDQAGNHAKISVRTLAPTPVKHTCHPL